jgi:hypothetical protein
MSQAMIAAIMRAIPKISHQLMPATVSTAFSAVLVLGGGVVVPVVGVVSGGVVAGVSELVGVSSFVVVSPVVEEPELPDDPPEPPEVPPPVSVVGHSL